MSEKQHGVSKRLCNYRYLHRREIIGTLFLWGMLFLAAVLLLSFASLQFEEPIEGYDLSFRENSPLMLGLPYPFIHSIHITAVLDLLALMLWSAYLKSHIGEKQSPDGESEANNRFFVQFPETALFCCAVSFYSFFFGQIGSYEKQIYPFCREEAA